MGDSRRLLSGWARLDIRQPFLSDFSTLSMQLSACMRFAAATERRHDSLSGEHPLENRVNLLQVIAEVEQRLELLRAKNLGDGLVGFQKLQELAFAAPGAHRVCLDDRIGVLARDALLRQRQQHP